MPPVEDRARIRVVEAFGELELIEAVHQRPHFSRHAHPTYGLGVVCWGANRFRYRGAFHTAAAGSLCTVTPGEVHAVEPAGNVGFAYRCLYPAEDLLQRAAAWIGGSRAGRTLALPPVIQDTRTAQLVRAFFESEGATPLAREAQLLSLLARVVTRHAIEPVAGGAVRRAPEVAMARDYLAAHSAENVTLARLAGLTGLDPYTLVREFTRVYGLPPHAWLLQQRVRRAQVLLRAGRAPGEVAAAVGFADQSHLNRHFKRVLGVTPGRYRHGAGAA